MLLSEFLKPMLEFSPERRATAAEMLQHPWLCADAPPGGAAAQPGRREDMRRRGSGGGSSEASAQTDA
eukprot:173395-Chlamydomonas_euryale.AAC.1